MFGINKRPLEIRICYSMLPQFQWRNYRGLLGDRSHLGRKYHISTIAQRCNALIGPLRRIAHIIRVWSDSYKDIVVRSSLFSANVIKNTVRFIFWQVLKR